MRITKIWLLVISMFLVQTSLSAAYTVKEGRLVNKDQIATMPVEDHYRLACEAMAQEDWREAAKQFKIVSYNFPNSSYGEESFFYLGQCFYQLEDYDFANTSFSNYIACQSNPKFFQEAIEYKYNIAEQFRCGARRHVAGSKKLPKWQTGGTLAIQIYDEVVAAAPSHDLAARSLYSKAYLLWGMKEFRDSVDCYQMLIKRFPKHELTPEAYLLINKVYCELAKLEFGNPDILAFAQINLRKFQNAFPREERLPVAQQDVLRIQEVYANGLYQTGCFYERMDKPEASLIYYQKTIEEFPDTAVANCCRKRIEVLAPRYAPELFSDETPGTDFDLEPFDFSDEDHTS